MSAAGKAGTTTRRRPGSGDAGRQGSGREGSEPGPGRPGRLRRGLRDNGLGLVFGGLFLLVLAAQAVAGHADANDRRLGDGGAVVSFWSYVLSSDFAVDVAENWQSEYLQFFLFIMATVWLVQRGSPESKPPERIGRETDEQQQLGAHATDDSPAWARAGGWRTALFSRSLGLTMLGLFLLSWLAQAVAGRAAYNNEQLTSLEDPVSLLDHVTGSDFWSRTTQNWQSELLAVGSMAVLAVYLRERGSPESKPVGASHTDTDDSG